MNFKIPKGEIEWCEWLDGAPFFHYISLHGRESIFIVAGLFAGLGLTALCRLLQWHSLEKFLLSSVVAIYSFGFLRAIWCPCGKKRTLTAQDVINVASKPREHSDTKAVLISILLFLALAALVTVIAFVVLPTHPMLVNIGLVVVAGAFALLLFGVWKESLERRR